MANVAIGDGNLKASVAGSEKIPVSGAGKPVINADLIAEYFGTWTDYTPVFTGFSLDPTVTIAKYCKIGKLCFLSVFLGGTATSNATTFTITAPFNAAFSISSVFANPVDNGAAVAPGHLNMAPGSNVINLYKSAFAAWTSSGTKRGSFTFFYITE